MVTLECNFQLSIIVTEIVSTLYTPEGASIEAAEHFLSLLRQWSQSLPQQVRMTIAPSPADEDAQGLVVGSLHISCYYYFAVILVSRPFLISNLIAKSSTDQGTAEERDLGDGSTSKTVAEMGGVCIDAAVLMAQTCSDVDETGFLLENMCILK